MLQMGNTTSGVHAGDKHEAGRISNRHARAGNGHLAFFHWLTHHFEHGAFELGQFIEK